MKVSRFFCIVIVLLICASVRSEAGGGWHGGGGGWGGWHGGGGWGWRGGGGVVIVTPGYYYPPYPYYYDDPYSDGYYSRPVYYSGASSTVSIATAVQEELSRMGYYKGPIDGIVGSGTRAVIATYQRNHGLEVSGTIDTPLIRSLRL